MEKIEGNSNVQRLTIPHKGRRATSGNQDSRQNILAALDAGEVVAWYFTGAKGKSVTDFVAVAHGRDLVYLGHKLGYEGAVASLRIAGTLGLGLLSSTFTGRNGTVRLPGSMTSTCWDPENKCGVDSDDYAQHLLLQAAGI